jgi:hypothetical protein
VIVATPAEAVMETAPTLATAPTCAFGTGYDSCVPLVVVGWALYEIAVTDPAIDWKVPAKSNRDAVTATVAETPAEMLLATDNLTL